MADISKITLPSGTTYDIKDSAARELIASLSGALTYLGTSSTALTDGCTTSPITVGSTSVTPKAGDIAAYGNSEFVWSAAESKWREFGSTGSLKALAFKDSVSASYTPAGTVSQPAFTGTKATISSSFTPAGTVAISKGTGTANYTPEGTVSAPDIAVATGVRTIRAISDVDGGGRLPSFTATVTDETLSLNFNAGKLYDTEVVDVVTDVTADASQPKFTGAGVELKAAFSGSAGTATASYTPAGTVSKPTFTGSAATITST